jgi:hypothetical protein
MFNTEKISLTTMYYTKCKVPYHILQSLKSDIAQIQQDFSKSTRWSSRLAGVIEHSYQLSDSVNYLAPFLNMQAREYAKHIEGPSGANKNFSLGDNPAVWVNFQKKYEFNPPHLHGHDSDKTSLSFVIWTNVPFNIEDERQHPSVRHSSINSAAGSFNFFIPVFANPGGLMVESLPVDRSWEGTMIMFPSWMWHSVNPFYTSDDYRISVAGNLIVE